MTSAAAETEEGRMSLNTGEAVRPRTPRPGAGGGAVVGLSAAVAIGLAIGVVTSFAQAWLTAPWSALANSASPWLAGGFAAGALQARRGTAVAAGLSACALEVLSYYVTSVARGFAVGHAAIIFWTVCALVGGPLFGLVGWACRRETGRARALGAAFLPGTFIAEALGAYLLRLHYGADAALYLVTGAILLAAVAWPVRRLDLLIWTSVVALVGLLAFGPLLAAAAGSTVGG
jgi:hypothetical protein